MSRRHRRRQSGTRRRPQEAAETPLTARELESYLFDEQGEPYPPLIRELIVRVLSGTRLSSVTCERLDRINEELEHCIRVCEARGTPINMEAVLLEVLETLQSTVDEVLS
jgi:hypothetical protein